MTDRELVLPTAWSVWVGVGAALFTTTLPLFALVTYSVLEGLSLLERSEGNARDTRRDPATLDLRDGQLTLARHRTAAGRHLRPSFLPAQVTMAGKEAVRTSRG